MSAEHLRVAFISVHGCPLAHPGERDTGGMNAYLLQTATELGRCGVSVDVFTRTHDPQDPQVVELGANSRVIHLKAGPHRERKDSLYRYLPVFARELQDFCEGQGLAYDLLHSHYWLSGWVGEDLARTWGVPHVITFHTLGELKLRARAGEVEPPLRLPTERRLLTSTDRVVSLSTHEKEALARIYGVNPFRVRVIPAGVDSTLFCPTDRQQAKKALGLAGQRVVLYVGRLQPLKGVHLLIQAIAQVEDRQDLKLVVVGGDPSRDRELERLRRLAHRLGIAGQVEFRGTVPHRELPAYYNAAEVCVLPSYYESFGLVALEAMACGTPVLAARVGGLPSIVVHGQTGYLVPWHCPDPYAEWLEMLLGNPALRETLGRAARERALAFTWSQVAQQLLHLYRHLLPQAVAATGG